MDMSHDEKWLFLKSKNICYRCLCSTDHRARDCKTNVKCDTCDKNHLTVMHTDQIRRPDPGIRHGGEKSTESLQQHPQVSSMCTTLCEDRFIGRSCSKTVLVEVYPSGQPCAAVRVYAIIDDQSNRTLATQELFDRLCWDSQATSYTLSSCSGKVTMFGRTADNLCVKSINGDVNIRLPKVTECDEIPNETSEIPTPDVARAYSHLSHLADKIPEYQPQCKVQLLIGRDLPEAHHVKDQVIGEQGTPFAQKLSLGWVIVGEVCLGKLHSPTQDVISVYKTFVMPNGRATIMSPCEYNLNVKEASQCYSNPIPEFKGDDIFLKTTKDNVPGLSVEDRQFLRLLEKEMFKDDEGYWSAPLPFKPNRPALPNNRTQAWRRAQILDTSLKRDNMKRQHFITFMAKVLASEAAEVAPMPVHGECWYLPLFGVYHPRKPDQIRGVFDSSAVFQNTSLNSVLMSGPDMINNLLGLVLRFRKDRIAITADVEQMFYRFKVNEEHRNFLRFFWYKDNNPAKDIIEYRMKVHVFGNTSSPAVASFGLRKSVENANNNVKDFVSRNFYVDDALASRPDTKEAIQLMKDTQVVLKKEGNIRLHKIASNSLKVMCAFPTEDLGTQVRSMQPDTDLCSLPTQRSLGMYWDLNTDSFTYDLEFGKRLSSRRNVLSLVNSIFDPVGFIAPITISGKILLREATPPGVDWDSPLPPEHEQQWIGWKNSLEDLRKVTIPRMYTDLSFSLAKNITIHVFSDASEKAIAAVAYLKTTDEEGRHSTGFIMGKAKLAPSKGHTIPRLELCGAVLSTEIAEIISEQLDIPLTSFRYYTDSRVVLGYINNSTRRFYTYVSNRIERIRSVSSPSQWQYVSTEKNPADFATRNNAKITDINDSTWIKGPAFLKDDLVQCDFAPPIKFDILNPDSDCEVRPEIHVCALKTGQSETFTSRFEKFSTWTCLVTAICILVHIIDTFLKKRKCEGHSTCWHVCEVSNSLQNRLKAEELIIHTIQRTYYQVEVDCLENNKQVKKDSAIVSLNPILDEHGLLRVGGRLRHASTPTLERTPIIIPKKSHIAILLVRHFHAKVRHQGRLITEGALRAAGFWIIGCKRLVSSIIQKCVTCRKLRGKLEMQKMADLPPDRLEPGPPFTAVGVDTFGPWEVVSRKTRGGQANNKRWAIIFTCMTTRAIHIEVVEALSSSAFINALRRFIALRGEVKIFRSDRGTNFIGTVNELDMKTVNVEDKTVKQFLNNNGAVWIFNSPHASHMGGVWERLIGVTRNILNSILSESKYLTHEILTTVLAEVCAIINGRPLVAVSTDPECPEILSPSMLVTQKTGYSTFDIPTFGKVDPRSQWKFVQVLANRFWKLWQSQYLHTLQTRRKWTNETQNLKEDDIVLVKDKEVCRNEWPMAVVHKVFPSSDGKVRKVQIRLSRNEERVILTRPIQELVLLLSDGD